MGIRIDNTPQSLFAQRQVNRTSQSLQNRFQQLATGLRINRAADDAAGLAISERFRTQIRQFNQETNGIQSGISLAQTAEGGLSAQQDAVGRLQELATQAANGTLSDDQRAAINEEAQQLLQEIDATSQNTEFNGVAPLENGTGDINLDAEGEVQINIDQSNAASLGIDNIDLSTQAGAEAALGALDGASQQISTARAEIGAQENRLNREIEQRAVQSQSLQEADSRLRDLDIARAVIEQTRDETLLQAGVSALAQGNIRNDVALRLLGA